MDSSLIVLVSDDNYLYLSKIILSDFLIKSLVKEYSKEELSLLGVKIEKDSYLVLDLNGNSLTLEEIMITYLEILLDRFLDELETSKYLELELELEPVVDKYVGIMKKREKLNKNFSLEIFLERKIQEKLDRIISFLPEFSQRLSIFSPFYDFSKINNLSKREHIFLESAKLSEIMRDAYLEKFNSFIILHKICYFRCDFLFSKFRDFFYFMSDNSTLIYGDILTYIFSEEYRKFHVSKKFILGEENIISLKICFFDRKKVEIIRSFFERFIKKSRLKVREKISKGKTFSINEILPISPGMEEKKIIDKKEKDEEIMIVGNLKIKFKFGKDPQKVIDEILGKNLSLKRCFYTGGVFNFSSCSLYSFLSKYLVYHEFNAEEVAYYSKSGFFI